MSTLTFPSPRRVDVFPHGLYPEHGEVYAGAAGRACAQGLAPRRPRRLHHTRPATSTGASHQPKTRAEIATVASACNTASEASQDRAATRAGLQAGGCGAGLATGS